MDDVLDILSERTPSPSQGDMVSQMLPKVIDKFDRVYVVVDELDQMTENRRRLYSSLLGLRNENLRLFLTTCHSPDEKSRLHKDPQILISGANVGKDLDTYITKRLTDLPKFIGYRPTVECRVKKNRSKSSLRRSPVDSSLGSMFAPLIFISPSIRSFAASILETC
jgi:hypothetical protein